LFSQPSITLGDAILYAKSLVGDQDVRRTFVLFSDPMLQLKQSSVVGASVLQNDHAGNRTTPDRRNGRPSQDSRRSTQ
jgi:UTP-glucose-1-phosphate uridylyltransferase